MESRNKAKKKFYNLSEPQKMIYIAEVFDPGTSLNTISIDLKMEENTNKYILKCALENVIRENPALNIQVTTIGGVPYQFIENSTNFNIEILDFRDTDDNNQEKIWLESRIKSSFSMESEKLYYFAIYQKFDGTINLLLQIHHIIADGGTFNSLTNQIKEKYNILLNNKTDIFDPKYSYLKYIETEENYINSNRFQKSREFWVDKFKDVKGFNSILNSNNINSNSLKALRYQNNFNKEIQKKIVDICSENNISYASFFLACLLITLNKVFRKLKHLLGTASYNRLGRKEKEAVGMFVNILPLYLDISKENSFKDIIDLIDKEMAGVMKHQRYPQSYISNDNELKHLNISNSIEIIYTYQNPVLPYEYKYHFCNYGTHPIFFRPIKFGDDGFHIEIDYQTECFSNDEIENFSYEYQKVIEGLSSDINNKVDLIKDKESEHSCFEGQNVKYNLDQTIHELFENSVLEFEDSKAISFQGTSITYKELNKRANHIANILIENGAGNEKPVVLILDRSLEMMISILAVLKTGSCYLPLSPEQPLIRTEKIISMSDSSIVLYNHDVGRDIESDVVKLDIRSIYYPENYIDNPNVIVSPESLAYIMYTSGSTGEPKGVMIEHHSVLNRLFWMQRDYPLNKNDVLIQKTPYTFDVSVWELFGWFLGGCSLHFLIPGGEKVPGLIAEAIHKERVTVANFVPSMLTLFLEYIDRIGSVEYLETIRRISCTGEAVLPSHIKLFNRVFGNNKGVNFFNLYGPVEATIEVSSYICRGDEDKFVPIGKPIHNTQLYVLGENREILPPGKQGEIHIAGICLARGYFKRDDLTNDKFWVHPEINKRLYSTGDLGLFLDDGNIKFLGRIDNQVKIRGNRVELGEIETCLSKFNGISESAVLAPIDEFGNAYLGAYYSSDKEIQTEELRNYLKDQLPSYMIPSYFVYMKEFPMTSSGKLDRKKLPEPTRANNVRKPFHALINDREEEICEIWEEVLEVDNIGRDDNFFDLGGDSLKLIRVHFVLQEKYEVTLQDLFEFQTIESLAQHIKLRQNNILNFNPDEYNKILSEKSKNMKILDYQRSLNYSLKTEIIQFNNILITGATGFLGSFILREYIKNTKANLFLVVRGYDYESSKKRLFNKLEYYFGDRFVDKAKDRITVLCGDIAEPELGLDKYYDYIDVIDCVVHCAAIVKHFGSREEVDKINVTGTENVIEFCKVGTKKSLSFISTMSIGFNNIGYDPIFTENDFPRSINKGNVYLESKIKAEELVLQSKSDINVKILRVGNVVSDSDNGIFQENYQDNAFYNLMHEYLKKGCVPDIEIPFIDLSSVNEVAKAVMLISNTNNSGVYHLYNPNLTTLSLFFKGKDIDILQINNFMTKISYGDKVLVHGHYLKNLKLLEITNCNSMTILELSKLGFKWSNVDGNFIIKLWNSWEKIQSNVTIGA